MEQKLGINNFNDNFLDFLNQRHNDKKGGEIMGNFEF